MSEMAYAVGSVDWCNGGGMNIERIYLDREQAQAFLEAHNAVDYDWELQEFPIGRPDVEYDGPYWKAEWREGWTVTSDLPPSHSHYFEPFWSEERLNINSEWREGAVPPAAEVRRILISDTVPALITAYGSSRDDVERVINEAISEVKASRAGAVGVAPTEEK